MLSEALGHGGLYSEEVLALWSYFVKFMSYEGETSSLDGIVLRKLVVHLVSRLYNF